MKQRTRIAMCVLVPLLCGCGATAVASWLPIVLQYFTWVDSAADDIVNRELAVLFNVSSLLAANSRQFMQSPANFVLMISSLMEEYYLGNLLVKSTFLDEANYVNAVKLELQRNVSLDYSMSMWYLNPDIREPSNLPPISRDHLYQTAVFDSFARPSVSPVNINRTWQVWYGFDSDGLMYLIPSASYTFWIKYSGDPYCQYYADEVHFDPRCRPWYKQTLNSSTQYIPTITDPFAVLWRNQIGQNVCIRVEQENELVGVVCIDYDIQPLIDVFQRLNMTDAAYGFALTTDGSVFTHPKLDRTLSKPQSILELEFGSETSSEARDFNESVLPYFLQGSHVFTKYKKDGDTMLLSIAPVNVMLSGNRLFYRILSVGVVLPEAKLTKKVESLKRETAAIFIAEVLIFAGLIVGLLVCGWLCVLSRIVQRTVSAVIRPLDDLADALSYMLKGDLLLTIAPKQICSAEIVELYQIFEKLKIVLRFNDPRFFDTNPASAVITLCQALHLFQEFNNHRAVGACWWHLGHLHLQTGKSEEAAHCFREAYYNAMEMLERAENKKILADRSLQWALTLDLAQAKKAKKLIEAAVRIYQDLPYCQEKAALAKFELAKVHISLLNVDEAKTILARLQSFDSEELLQKVNYLQGRIAETEAFYQTAAECYTAALTCSARSDPQIHSDSLHRLALLFETFGLPNATVLGYTKECQVSEKDVALILGNTDTASVALRFFDDALQPLDRLAVITPTCQVVFPLMEKRKNTVRLRREIERCSDLPLRLLDALSQATRQLSLTDCMAWGDESPRRRFIVFLLSQPITAEEAKALQSFSIQSLSRLVVVQWRTDPSQCVAPGAIDGAEPIDSVSTALAQRLRSFEQRQAIRSSSIFEF